MWSSLEIFSQPHIWRRHLLWFLSNRFISFCRPKGVLCMVQRTCAWDELIFNGYGVCVRWTLAAILMSVALLVWDCAFLFWAAEVSAFVSIFAVCLTSVLNPPRRAKYVNFKNDPVDRSYGWKKNWYYVCLVQKTISRESIRRKMSEL